MEYDEESMPFLYIFPLRAGQMALNYVKEYIIISIRSPYIAYSIQYIM